MIWKNYSADPVVADVLDRSLGLSSEVAPDDARLDEVSKDQLHELIADGTDAPTFVHLTGLSAWEWLDELAERFPETPLFGVSHTTSDADEIRAARDRIDHVAISVMADAEAKIRYERSMFTGSFETLLTELPARFADEAPDLTERRLVVFGAAGKIIGSALSDALLGQHVIDQDVFSRITLIDPAFANPENAERAAIFEAAGFEIVAGTELPPARFAEPLVVVNATAGEVWRPQQYEALTDDDVVVMNLGTGQRGFAMGWVGTNSTPGEPIEPAGHQPTRRYRTTLPGGRELNVVALGDSYPYNLTTRFPNPPVLSEFNNLLILESLHDAHRKAAAGKLGAEVLGTLRVSFVPTYPPVPVVCLVDRDIPADAAWPTRWDPNEPGFRVRDGVQWELFDCRAETNEGGRALVQRLTQPKA